MIRNFTTGFIASLFGIVWATTGHTAACPAVPDIAFLSQHAATTTALQTAIVANRAAVETQMTLFFQQLVSALHVDVAQTNANGEQATAATTKSSEAMASVMTQQQQNEAILKAQEDFGPEGLPVDACVSTDRIAAAVSAISSYGNAAGGNGDVSKIDAAPGSKITGAEAVANRLTLHRQNYCTDDEVKVGLCQSVGAEPGKDVDVATLFEASASDEAKNAVINNLIGLPITKPTEAETKTAAGMLRMSTAIRAEAIRSPAINAIVAIKTANTSGSDGLTQDGGDQSAVEALDTLIDHYGGGSGFDAWYHELGTKSERGLMQEMNKLKALNMKLRNMQSDSNTRITAIMAALLAAEADQ